MLVMALARLVLRLVRERDKPARLHLVVVVRE